VTKDELIRLAHAGYDSFEFRREAAHRLRDLIPLDEVWWWTSDPATGFFTSFYSTDPPGEHDFEVCHRVHANEFLEPDYNKFRVLARRASPAGVLSVGTGGSPGRSARYRDIIVPMGYEHELRLALVRGCTCWGGLTLLRTADEPDFSDEDARALTRLLDPLTEGLRIGIVLGAVMRDEVTDGPGLLLLDGVTRIAATTPSAERWLDELGREEALGGIPEVVRSVASAAAQLEDEAASNGLAPRARLRTSSGSWLVVHASRLRKADDNIAVIIEEAKPSEIAPIVIEAYGLSEREAELTRLVLQGLSTKEIAAELLLSPYTVQDHLKSIFEKFDVRSRRELVARLFDRHYWPAYGQTERGPDANGAPAGFVRGAAA
jgi:DNA-binding CsgD family transcriptional regulator